MRLALLCLILSCLQPAMAQSQNSANDPEAAELLKKVSQKYQSYKNISVEFLILTVHPKIKAGDDERKLTDTLAGKALLQQNKFHIEFKNQEIICDGKNIWTYLPADKEVQLNYFEESDDMISPSKIFSLYQSGYLYQVKGKKTIAGKSATVVEMSPAGKKLSYFKIDVTIDDASQQLLETKIYEKNGIRYIYEVGKQSFNVASSDSDFTFDSKKHPQVKVVDLR